MRISDWSSDVCSSDLHPRIVEVEVRLVREKAVPVIGLRGRIPGPVRLLGVGEDDACSAVFLVAVAPDVVVAPGRARPGMARTLKQIGRAPCREGVCQYG